MGTRTLWASFAVIALLASGCTIFSYTWTAPPTVAAGAVFGMNITGVTNAASGTCWAVFQVPIGFEVLGAGYVVNGGLAGYSPAIADPMAMAPYVASPGHQLFGVGGFQVIQGSQGNVDAKVYVRAPSAAGSYTLRMALAVGGAPLLQPQLGPSQLPDGERL